MGYLEEVAQQIREWDDDRPRSQQGNVGWSHMSDCRAYLGFVERGDWPSDDDDNWRAIAGTGLHGFTRMVRERAVSRSAWRVAGSVSWELEVEYRGVTGHVDEVDWDAGEVTDWKFPRKASAVQWDDPDVLEERFIQLNGYAAGVMETPLWKELHGDKGPLVRVLVAPVDGNFSDWVCYEREFDRQSADDAVERYQLVKKAVAEGTPLPRDKPWFFCERFCEFFTLCRGGGGPGPELEEITDPELATAVERYGLALEQISAGERSKKEIRPLIEGLRGTARGWRIFTSRPGVGKMVYDEEQVREFYAQYGIEVPMVPRHGKPPSLVVKREKSG